MGILKRLRTTLDHPYANLLVAVILIVTSLAEGWETLQDDLIHLDIAAHHGVLLFGVFSLLKVIPELVEALERASRE